MDHGRIAIAAPFRRHALPAAAACLVAAAFAGSVAAQQPEIQFGKIDPAAGLSSDQAARHAEPAPSSLGSKSEPTPAPAPTLPGTGLTPHLGLDVGGSGATLDGLSHPITNGVQNNSDPDRRYRAKAGIDYDVNSKIQLGLGYSYSNYEHPDLVLAPSPDTELESQQREQAAKFSLRYKFGGPE